MIDHPVFSDPLDLQIAGDDPLGLAPTNERLYGAVFPGVNNVVRYIRVYSAICWIVQRAAMHLKENASSLKKREAKQIFDRAIEKVELALAWVSQDKGYIQIAGAGRKFPDHDEPVSLQFSTFGPSKVSLLEAVAYRPSLTNGLGFLEQKEQSTFSCTAAGEILAEAFDVQARTSTFYEWLADISSISIRRSNLFQMEAILDVGRPSSAEQIAFLAQFFPSPTSRDFDNLTRNRWLALNLTLLSVDAVCRAKRNDADSAWASENEIRASMARGRTGNGIPLQLSGLETVQAWWAVLQLRQLQRLAIDVIYCVVERWLGKQGIEDGDTAIDVCCQSIGDCVSDGLEPEFQEQVQPCLEHFRGLQDTAENMYVAACGDAPDEQIDVFNYIEELSKVELGFSESGGNGSVTSAYVALIFCSVEVSNLLVVPETRDVVMKDQDSCSLIALMHLVERMKGDSPRALMSYLIKHWVVLRHFHVVADRSQRGDDKNRFRFVVGDHGLERFNPEAKMPEPAFAQDRLKHILILCAQAGLLEEMNGEYRLSAYGRQRLDERPIQ